MEEYTLETLKKKLEETESFPLVYLFKFILPSDNHKIAVLNSIFDEEAEISMRTTPSGKHTSITIKSVMISADDIIERYKKAGDIGGVMML